MNETPTRRGRVQLLLIAAVFLGPLLLAGWLYFAGTGLQPAGRTNNGVLLEPIINISAALPDSPLNAVNDGYWVLLYANDGICDDDCEFALYTLRQSRLMLGREMDRLERVFLHGETLPDTVLLADEHPGLVALQDAALYGLINEKRPGAAGEHGYYLLDPLGNLVMYFPPDIDPAAMVEDIEHLLELSRIG